MAETKMRIKIRRDLSTKWTSINPTLLVGEQGYETDTGKMKIGDGSSRWNSLPYFGTDVTDIREDLEELNQNAVRRTGDTMSGGLKIANENKYKLEVIPEAEGRPAGSARFTYDDRVQAELYWDPENSHIDFSFPSDNRVAEDDVMLELGKDALRVFTLTDIKGDLFVNDVDVLAEINRVKLELAAELLGLSIALKTKYNKEGGSIFGPVEVKPNGAAGLTLFKVTEDGAECPIPPVNDFSLTNKRYVDSTTIPFNLRRFRPSS